VRALEYKGSLGDELYLHMLTKGVTYRNDAGLVIEGERSDDALSLPSARSLADTSESVGTSSKPAMVA